MSKLIGPVRDAGTVIQDNARSEVAKRLPGLEDIHDRHRFEQLKS
jgi:hypothetical protein